MFGREVRERLNRQLEINFLNKVLGIPRKIAELYVYWIPVQED